MFNRIGLLLVAMLLVFTMPVAAHDDGEPIHGDETEGIDAEFDIVFA